MERLKQYRAVWLIVISLSLILPARAQAGANIKVLIVTAHPDDESVCAATVYKINRDLKGKVDIVVITNGEAGFKYSTVAEDIYGVELTDERVGREHLPAIRKREMMNAGRVIGIRNFYFLDQQDNRFTLDPQEVLQGVWDVELVKRRLKDIIVKGEYDYVLVLLPGADTHGHHKAATIMALETVKALTAKRPVVLGCQVVNKANADKREFTELPGYALTRINKSAPVFTFDRTQRFGFKENLNYKIIVGWLIAEHKSQGLLQMQLGEGELERFWYFDINDTAGIEQTNNLFKQLQVITYKNREY